MGVNFPICVSKCLYSISLGVHFYHNICSYAFSFFVLMSIVLSVHPGVQLDTRVDSKKSFCRSVMEGT